MKDLRLKLDAFDDLKMPKLWSSKFNQYSQETPGYWDLVADWTALLITRLITYQQVASNRSLKCVPILSSSVLEFIKKITANKKLSNFEIFADQDEMESLINFIVWGGEWNFEPKLIKKRVSYGLELTNDHKGDDLISVDLELIKQHYIRKGFSFSCLFVSSKVHVRNPIESPPLALPRDTWPQADDNPVFLTQKLRKENAKLKNKSTRVCGLSSEYCLYTLKANQSHWHSYWYKHKAVRILVEHTQLTVHEHV